MKVKVIDFTSGNGISNVNFSFFNSDRVRASMGWLPLVGSLKSYVSLAKEPYMSI